MKQKQRNFNVEWHTCKTWTEDKSPQTLKIWGKTSCRKRAQEKARLKAEIAKIGSLTAMAHMRLSSRKTAQTERCLDVYFFSVPHAKNIDKPTLKPLCSIRFGGWIKTKGGGLEGLL